MKLKVGYCQINTFQICTVLQTIKIIKLIAMVTASGNIK